MSVIIDGDGSETSFSRVTEVTARGKNRLSANNYISGWGINSLKGNGLRHKHLLRENHSL